jgi:hypothetical protein
VRIRITGRDAFGNEGELLAFARFYLSEAFPNPERTGCTPDDALRLFAIRPLQSDESIGEHLTCCSPCFNAYMAHLAEARAEPIQRQRIRRITWIRRCAAALGIAAILVIAVYLFVSKRRTAPIVAPRTPAPITAPGTPDQTQTTAMYVPVVIDFTNVSPTRGSKQVPGGSVPQIIPSRSPLDLSLRLPLGSEERLFSITLRSGRHIVWSESTQARRQNGDTLLRVHADFRDVPTGRYNLQVASTGRRLSVPVLIKGGLPKNKEQKR